MISANDTTILAVLSRYPDMPHDEAEGYISKIEHEENIPVCRAVVGILDKDDLGEDARTTFDEFQRWSLDRTRRVRNEQWTARRRQKETRTALKLTKLHERGLISDQTMLMYGISGDMPERDMYQSLTHEEKEALWRERMESRFGPNWMARFNDRNLILPTSINRTSVHPTVNWLREGF